MSAGIETPAAHANPALPESWYPAGPAEDTLAITIFASNPAEFTALSAGSLDLMDSRLTAPQQGAICASTLFFCASSKAGVFAYSSSWARVINSPTVGVPNFFTWLNAYALNQPVCSPIQVCQPPFPIVTQIRQGFAKSTTSLNPYQAPPAVRQNFYVLDNVYDRLYRANPMNPNQILDWMTSNSQILDLTQLTYTPPVGTLAVLRNTLRSGINFHDGYPLSAWDVAFSYLSLMTTAAPQLPFGLQCPGPAPACLVTGLTVLGTAQFDIDLNATALTTLQKENVGSLTILPGRLWSMMQSMAWENCKTSTPAVFSVPSPQSCMTVNPGLVNADPLVAENPINFDQGILIGSGPWLCGTYMGEPLQKEVGTGCTTSLGLPPGIQTQNPGPGGTITLQRFGCELIIGVCEFPGNPEASPFYYFRSSGNLALYLWTGNTGNVPGDFTNLGLVAACVGQKVLTPGCTRWQEGIGNPAPPYPFANGPAAVGSTQVSYVQSYSGVSWTEPFAWAALTGIGNSPPVLYEGTNTLPQLKSHLFQLNPDPPAGCSLPLHPATDYPNGSGYNC